MRRHRLRKRYGHATGRIRYTVEAGRQILKDGAPFIGINRQGDTHPSDADEVTHIIADCLNGQKVRR
jgi:hypothetical protein